MPTAAEQQEIIAEAEDERASAFSVSQEDIDMVLARGGIVENGKFRIYEHFMKNEGRASNISFLKDEYGIGGAHPITGKLDEWHDAKGIRISVGLEGDTITLSWNEVAKRIAELIKADRYLSQKEKKEYPRYLNAQQERLERTKIANEFRDIIYEYNAYQSETTSYDKQLNQYVLSDCASRFKTGQKITYALTMQGNYILPMMRDALNLIIGKNIHLTERCKAVLEQLNGELAVKLEPAGHEMADAKGLVMEYRFNIGDTVYIGSGKYEVLAFNDEVVRLYDTTFPIINKEMARDEFEKCIAENPANEHLLVEVAAAPQPPSQASSITSAAPEQKPGQIPEQVQKNGQLVPNSERINFKITNNALGVGTKRERYENNIAAIKVLKNIEAENRLATPDEQEIMARYVGWGGLSECFDETNSRFGELKSLLTDSEFTAARESTLTAFYTPPVVIRSVYQALENMGFKTGNILEPSCGVGSFMGMLPETMNDSKMYGIELDSISGRIAKQLYQKSNIEVAGYERTNLPDSFFDAAVGNVPFGQFKLSDKRYDRNNWLIHDYFFGKTLDKVRPGGIIAFVTSKGTMDKKNPAVRKYIAQRAELIGAVRLPNNTFSDAAGTEVTSDIIFLQKRDRIIDVEPDWVHLSTDENGIAMNSYFVEHPEMVLGEMVMKSGPFGPESTCKPLENTDLEGQLAKAISSLQGEITAYEAENIDNDESMAIPADPDVRNFSYSFSDGQLYYRENSIMKPISLSDAAEKRLKSILEIRDCVRTLIAYQTEEYSEADILTQQKKLNELYDSFVEKYGRLNDRANKSAIKEDSSAPLLASLEKLDGEGKFIGKADIFSKRTIKSHTVVTSVDTASEALAVSLAEKAHVDMDYMSELTGKQKEEIIDELHGVIYRVPFEEENGKPVYHTAEEYLSGNVREKLRIAEKAAETMPELAVNVEALKKVMPQDLTTAEISVKLGSTWIPKEYVQQFVYELMSTPIYARREISVNYSGYTNEWNIEGKNYDKGNIRAYSTYGTKRMNAYKILEETLNLRDVRVFDYIEDEYGRKRAVLNNEETQIAKAKQDAIKQKFVEWIWKDPQRRETLLKIYNERFNSIRPREYDGSHIEFVGMNPEISLRQHQRNAVAHVLYGGNTLLAHVVGAGKTFEMVAAAQESKRLGLCQKSLFVVPNHLTEQWGAEYLQLYPAANILVATKKDFEPVNRRKFCAKIATGDYDAVIIGHTQFEKIPMSVERQRASLNAQIEEITAGIKEAKANKGDSFTIKQLEAAKKSIEAKLLKLNDQSRKDDVVTFEELGVDRLFVDEAHYYKNLYLYTKMRNVGGIAQTEALKSSDLFMKCRYLDEITGNRGTIFATGTPISNSMTELYTMQRYLQMSELKAQDLQHFDSWASTFGETVTAHELSPEGKGYRLKTRFSKFYNLPELMNMFKTVADIQTADMLKLPVPTAHRHNVVLKPSEHQKAMVEALAERAEKVRGGSVSSNIDNMLLITNDGRKLALDQRLIDPRLPADPNSKSAVCTQNVFEIYQNTEDRKGTQLIFCDLSTPSAKGEGGFCVYDDIKKALIDKGIPENQIEFIHNAKTEAQKDALFAKVRNGDVRILIGSTQKMGAGTNVQDNLVAIHHLDCPWRPSDLEQREGRIIRQGNKNKEVDIYSYVTEGTFDAYLYQLVENKQKFIGQIMTSKSPARSAEDIDERALSYAEIKALATGNPLIKEQMDLSTEVKRLNVLKMSFLDQKYALENAVTKDLPMKLQSAKVQIKGYKADLEILKANTSTDKDAFHMTISGISYNSRKDAGAKILEFTKKVTDSSSVKIGSYKGFDMSIYYDYVNREYLLNLKGKLTHTIKLGSDPVGCIRRIDNELSLFEDKIQSLNEMMGNIETQLETARAEYEKPFPYQNELEEKTARLNEVTKKLSEMERVPSEIQDTDMKCKIVTQAQADKLEKAGIPFEIKTNGDKTVIRYKTVFDKAVESAIDQKLPMQGMKR